MIEDTPRIIHKNGERYIKLPDAKTIQERRERKGYEMGYGMGEKLRIWGLHTGKTPCIQTAMIPKYADVDSYLSGFQEGYYQGKNGDIDVR